jgi:hypothetical protein
LFIPSDTKRTKVTNLMQKDKDIVEGFGGREKSGPYISKANTTEYMKIIRLIAQDYSLEFWQQPGIMKELKETLTSRLQASGEKLAETVHYSGRSWPQRSFTDGLTLPPGYTGFEPLLGSIQNYPSVIFVHLYVEIA